MQPTLQFRRVVDSRDCRFRHQFQIRLQIRRWHLPGLRWIGGLGLQTVGSRHIDVHILVQEEPSGGLRLSWIAPRDSPTWAAHWRSLMPCIDGSDYHSGSFAYRVDKRRERSERHSNDAMQRTTEPAR